jgi:DNA polymerase-3 subunit alpha
MPPKGFPTTQFSMIEAEDVGLYKYDILSQRGLSKIEEALHIIRYNTGKPAKHAITDINYFKKDEKIKKLLQAGDAMGCFYVESPAMRMLMKKLNVSNYLELVAASSIIRPGVSSSGMMKEYILRHKDPERRKKAHPVLLDIMPETYGVMVYQEDVIKVAHHFAGLSLDEADILRRGMSGKYRSREEFRGIQQQFFENCLSKGYPPSLTKEIWKQIESFAGYAFSKGHSASFAVESFQSLYLKAYYPLEYMVATINNGGGYYRTEIYVHEAQRLGGTIEAPEINKSQWSTCIQKSIIFLGFQHVNGLEKAIIERLLIQRKKQGHFSSLEGFINTVRPGLETTLLLIRIGSFRSFNTPKKELLWQAHLHYKKEYHKKDIQSLFPPKQKKFKLPVLESPHFEQAFEELELLGFSLTSPFELIAEQKLFPHISAKELSTYKGRKVRCYGYLISVKKTFTNKGETMYFGHFYDSEGTLLDTVHFPNTLPRYRFQGIGVYMLEGIATEEFGFFSLTISKMEKCPYMEDPRYKYQFINYPFIPFKKEKQSFNLRNFV